MNKPIKPNITIPESFALNGVKTDFDNEKLANGFDNLQPDVLAGDNLNKFIDDTYQGLNYGMAAADAINLINEGETLTVVDGKLTSGASGGGLEIGDIGIAPLGIDETKGKRRYLNGQIVIQEQYVQFTNKLKSAIALYPSLACTEEEWQATALLTVGGQVGKFVVDNDAGTIRLPKIIMPIQGLTDLSKLAEIVEAGLPNITGITGNASRAPYGTGATGAFYDTGNTSVDWNGTGTTYGYTKLGFDASNSNSIYGNSDTVQQEQIQYPYFIQVATGAETEDNIINEIELNNPYSLGDSKYSPLELNNLSWLKSEGQWNSKAVYPSFYDWALTNFNNNVEGFALSTGEFTDYDFVLNTAEETFRLPLLDGSESLLSDKKEDFNYTSSGMEYTAPANGWVVLSCISGITNSYLSIKNNTSANVVLDHAPNANDNVECTCEAKKGDVLTIAKTATGAVTKSYFIYAQGNGSLYFYVGETVQNANLINAGRIEEKIASLIPDNSSLISGYAMPSNRYIDLTLGASGTTYTAPANGYVCIAFTANTSSVLYVYVNKTPRHGQCLAYNNGMWVETMIPVQKGEPVTIQYGGNPTVQYFNFIYLEGEV